MKQRTKKIINFSASYLAKIAILTALSFVLYAFGKFNLPFMFPGFLEMQFSELPALLAGFSMGPLSGCIVIVLKCLLKMPMTSTAFVGELTDIIIGVAFVLPSSLIYHRKKDKEHAIWGLVAGTFSVTLTAVLLNRYVSIPFYVEFFFNGKWEILLGICSKLYKGITKETFFTYYLLLAIIPFNLLRCILIASLTFLLYKRLSKVLHWEGGKLKTPIIDDVRNCEFISNSVKDTYYLAQRLASTLKGGEIIVLEGELGAGKTTFTKGLAESLWIDENTVTSPTFTIMKSYKGKFKLYHFDMYRIENEQELDELGFEEFFNDSEGICVIEWNKYKNLNNVINIIIERINENSRKFTIGE